MNIKLRLMGLTLVLTLIIFSPLMADIELESLQENQKIHGFSVVNLYENSAGKVMGTRLVSDRYGFIIDLMQIQSVPQAFYWIKTPPTSSKGEPHACEHLLLGKGNRGRYIAALEDMSLGSSSAYTAQLKTCYHFNTIAGEETFYDLFESKLMAFLNPNFTDEEIRREVCHIGVVVNQDDGVLTLDEKGTVYTEMISSFEKHWYHLYTPMSELLYGKDHPLTYLAGGNPEVMRNMVPKDLWKFHKQYHHLSNMGAIVSIPDDIQIDKFLKRMAKILKHCQSFPDSSQFFGIGAFDLPPAKTASTGTIKFGTYPSDKKEDPGYILYAWPSDLKLDFKEKIILELFLETFAGGETSNLYDLFINSQTRKIDIGGYSVSGGLDSDLGNSIYIELNGVDNNYITETMLDSVRHMILTEVSRIREFENGSEELLKFNKMAKSRLAQRRKQAEKYMNSPPMFGFRSFVCSGWLSLMESLEDEDAFRKSLVFKSRFDYAEKLLASDDNIWKDLIDYWRLLNITPYAVGTSPDDEMITRDNKARETRIAGYVENFKKKYGVSEEQRAIALYKEEFDKNTAELEAAKSKDKLPRFIDNPPLTLDDQLKYEVITLSNDIQFVASTFDNMTASQVGIALRLDVIPESLLVYVPILPSILTDIGVVKDGQVIEYDEMTKRLREEVLSLNAYFDHGFQTERVEIVLTGQGNNLVELKNALGWMDAALYSPYLSSENIPRMIDLIDQALISYRNTMKQSEEDWVAYPAYGYRFQHNPVFMSTNCFLTQMYHYQRLKWLLTDPGDAQPQKELSNFLNELITYGKSRDRGQLGDILTAIENKEIMWTEVVNPTMFNFSSQKSKNIVVEIAKILKVTLADIPDENLTDDWAYLCKRINSDLMVKPEDALAGFNTILDLIRKADNARMFMISNTSDRQNTLPIINGFIAKLDSKKASIRQKYAKTNRVIERLRSREPNLSRPVYVGLVNEGTKNGVLIFSTRVADVYDTSSTTVLNCLAGKMYGGQGPHGFFMNTWAAGLAYSNGFSINQSSGRSGYYAERCPDVAETMRFVVNLIKNTEENPELADYAIAQIFGYSRASSRYEHRGVAMANDLVDNRGPEAVRAYREKVLSFKNRKNLYGELKSRMEQAYGPVFIGYGAPLSESIDGTFFLIGPQTQFESLEKYIESTEGKQKIFRLYPRDFWLTM